ncbi:translocation/assembly module TamB domain-containing protein [Orrella sp. JC864]|uniref:translocation/assembly module TamB domain-containing protein n=1 Tax=Orrella sp. JC864 TaxID=3120298 RepID=UPI0030089B69
MLLLCLGGFLAWAVGSQAGTRMLLETVAAQLGGHAQDVQGTLWRGVRVRSLVVAPPGTRVELDNLNLAADWPQLGERLLRVQDLSADRIRVETASAPPSEEQDGGPFSFPVLPVQVAIDRLAVGRFELVQDGQPLPVEIEDLQATLALAQTAQLRLASLRVGHPMARTQLQGELRLDELAEPWPMDVQLLASVHSPDPQSPLCLDALRPAAGKAGTHGTHGAAQPQGCTVLVDAQASGSLERVVLDVKGEGAGVDLRAHAALAPQGVFPLERADLALRLADGSSLAAEVLWERLAQAGQPAPAQLPAAPPAGAGPAQPEPVRDRLRGSLKAERLDLGGLLAGAIPPAVLSATLGFDFELIDQSLPTQGEIDLAVGQGSRWNGQALQGTLKARMQAPASAVPGQAIDWMGLRLPVLQTDLRLGPNRLRTDGGWGEPGSTLALDVLAPRLAAFWPDLPGGATLKGQVGGTPAAHRAKLDAVYTPAKPREGIVGEAPARASLALEGGWGPGAANAFQAGLTGWRGTLAALQAAHAGFGLDLRRPLAVAFLPGAQAPQWQWQLGATTLAAGLPGQRSITLEHGGSRGGAGRWQSAGRAENVVVSPELIEDVQRALGQEPPRQSQRGGVRMAQERNIDRSMALDARWDLQFAGALAGTARIERRGGDLMIPGQPPVPVGLRELAVDLRATPTSGGASRLDAVLSVLTERMGNINGKVSAMLATRGGVPGLDERQPLRASLDADIADLAWVSLFTGDSLDIGGTLRANVQAEGRLDGQWQAQGTLKGEYLRVVRVDDGVRLIDGTLSARLENERFILESLRFPASLRVTPPEWRTREWITQNPDAQNGELRASGQWNLLESAGAVDVVLHRFPVLQRVDRYAMMSGAIAIKAALPSLSITGKLTADAGWASIDMLASVPTVDDDVIVVHEGQEIETSSALDTSMVLDIDLGPRFYLTGMGLDSGLVGALQIRLRQGRLTGEGALRTRGGRFEAYGQRLHLRRGTITFQDTLENPLLDIEALRLGEQVEAGVRVAGTARRPRIDLVSYPDVSETEKLSWLILGRGPDQDGNDAALLLSVGAALLGGDGEPFYRKFGLDDVGIRSGAMGSSGSLLPDTTVVGRVNRNSSQQLENQFLIASKRFSSGITLSVEQAMSGADTVARASYALSRRLSLDLKGGAVNGLELVYRTFFLD